MVTSVLATCSDTRKLSGPLLSRFFLVELEPYSYEQFYQITLRLLSNQSKVAPMRSGIHLEILEIASELSDLLEQKRVLIFWSICLEQENIGNMNKTII